MRYSRFHRPRAAFQYKCVVSWLEQGEARRKQSTLFVDASNSVNAEQKAIALVANVKGCEHRVDNTKLVGVR